MKSPVSDWKQITRDSYNEHASDFASFSSTYRGKMQTWTEEFAHLFSKGAEILDIGCGAGRDAAFFIEKGLSVTGVDFSEKLIEIIKNRLPTGKFFVMDFEELSFPENNCDGIWANASLYHIPKENLLRVFQKIYAVLKNDGTFFSTFRVGKGEKMTQEKRGNAMLERYAAYYMPEDIQHLLQKAGFGEIEFEIDHIETGNWMRFLARK